MKFKRGYYDVFVRTCAKYPSATAVRHYEDGIYKSYTYSELYGVCEYISQNLQQIKCNKGIIGLISERNIIIPCIIAAAHKCSTTFMFIDPSQDFTALSNEITFTVIVTIKNRDTERRIVLFGKKPEKTVTVFDLVIDFYSCNPPTNQNIKHVNQHSFIAMTSGSTGEPKHIQVPIQCIQPNIDDLTKMFNITPQDIIYFSTPLTFDPSMVEILLACLNGASLLIAPEKIDILFPENKDNSITFWQTTPSRFFQHSNADIKNKILSANSTLKILALGGEPLSSMKRLRELKEWDNKTKIFTLYGVTEMSCWACVAELKLDKTVSDREIPLGECLSETEVIVEPIKDENECTGKIILVSKTRNCFILNKAKGLGEENFMKFVDTGDLGEIKNGTIYYRGRKDDIIKRFGHKVNLQVIESTIMQCPRVKTCSCIWLPKPMLLVVYFSSERLSSQELSDFLKCKLDDKHWPDKVIRVDSLPTTMHGKISKQLVSKMYEKVAGTPPTTECLKTNFLKELKETLCKNFTFNEIKNKDFYSVGGTSFLALSLSNKMSLVSPQVGNVILPYLLSQKHSIGEILQIAQKETVEETKPKKKMKRSRSATESKQSSKDSSHMKMTSTSAATSCIPLDFEVAWDYDTGKCVDASPTLFQTGFNIYVLVGSHSGKIVIIEALSGALQGLVTIKSRVEAAVLCYPSPSPRGVVGAYDGTVICLEIPNGNVLWEANIGSMVKSKAACWDGIVYVASYDGKVRCIDITTGKIKETIHIADQAISADLVLAKNKYILIGTLSGVCASLHAPSNTVAWRGTLSSPVFASPVLYDDDKYVVFAEVSGEIHCRTVEKGIKIWRYQGAKGNIFSSIYIKEIDKLKWQMVFGCHDSNVYSINVKNYQPCSHWTTALSSPAYSTPCALTDKLVLAVSNNGKLYVIDSDSGNIISEYSLPSEVFSSPTVYEEFIFIGCRNDNVYSIKYSMNA